MNDFENEAVVVRRAAKLSALLAGTDEPAHAVAYPGHRIAGAHLERRIRRWSMAVAAAVAVVGVALFVPPVRAWVVARASHAWASLTGRGAPAAVPVSPGTTASSSVAFVPAAGGFTVQVARRQAEGNLRIEIVADTLATAVARGGSGDWLVLPDGVRLLNDAAATHDYLVRVPRRALIVMVQIGTERATQCPVGSVGTSCSFPLRQTGR